MWTACYKVACGFVARRGFVASAYVDKPLEVLNVTVLYKSSHSLTSDKRDDVPTGADGVADDESVVAEHQRRDAFELQLENYLTTPLHIIAHPLLHCVSKNAHLVFLGQF